MMPNTVFVQAQISAETNASCSSAVLFGDRSDFEELRQGNGDFSKPNRRYNKPLCEPLLVGSDTLESLNANSCPADFESLPRFLQ